MFTLHTYANPTPLKLHKITFNSIMLQLNPQKSLGGLTNWTFRGGWRIGTDALFFFIGVFNFNASILQLTLK